MGRLEEGDALGLSWSEGSEYFSYTFTVVLRSVGGAESERGDSKMKAELGELTVVVFPSW